MQNKLPVISLFSGAGGLDLAVERAANAPLEINSKPESPYKVAVSTDYDQDTSKTFKDNFGNTPSLVGDIREISTNQILEAGGLSRGDAALVIGGPLAHLFQSPDFG